MHVVEITVAVVWVAFWIYWLVAASTRTGGHMAWSRHVGIRVVIVLVVLALLRTGVLRDGGRTTDPWRIAGGLALLVGGLCFAIWARVNIGRNWGSPMTRKDDPELVTSGPYRLVRHPIYSGILVAGVGTAMALSWAWLTAVLLAGIYFVYSATVEERYMEQMFPDTYPAYRRSTKMLVPFLI